MATGDPRPWGLDDVLRGMACYPYEWIIPAWPRGDITTSDSVTVNTASDSCDIKSYPHDEPVELLPWRMGWQCPLCGTVYAPTVKKCKCGRREREDRE